MKKILPILLFWVFSCTALASGERDIKLTQESLGKYAEVDLSKQTKKLNYLGSTEQWHIFGETLTSVSGGMPYDNTFAYKVKKDSFAVENGWQFKLDKEHYLIFVQNCPAVYFNKDKPVTKISVPADGKKHCVLYTKAKEDE